jgi:hypothetical protein
MVLTRDVDTSNSYTYNISEDTQTMTVNSDRIIETPEEKRKNEYDEWCLTVPEDDRWTFDEFCNLDR